MGFYDLKKAKRIKLIEQINNNILSNIQENRLTKIKNYFLDEDTYIRKAAYQAIGKIYNNNVTLLRKIISILDKFLLEQEFKIRQTTINAAGEIGIKNFETVEHIFDRGLFDNNPSVRNAVIGSVKKMGSKNPKPILTWAKKYLHHPDKEIR